MTQLPDPDRELITFLQQHRVAAPPASPQLEDRVMTAIEHGETRSGMHRSRIRHWPSLWLAAPTIAAGFLVVLVTQQPVPTPGPEPNAAEIANLETFMENSWTGTVEHTPTTMMVEELSFEVGNSDVPVPTQSNRFVNE